MSNPNPEPPEIHDAGNDGGQGPMDDIEFGSAPVSVMSSGLRLGTLAEPVGTLPAETPLRDCLPYFEREGREYLPVVDAEGRPSGLISLTAVDRLLERTGDESVGHEPVGLHLLIGVVQASEETPMTEVLDLTLDRTGESMHYDLLVLSEEGGYVGLVTLRSLVTVLSRQILTQVQNLARKEDMLRQALQQQFRHSVEMRRAQKRDQELQENLRQAAQQQFRISLDLRRSQARYHILFENSAIGFALLNTSGETRTYNRHFSGLLKLPYPPQEKVVDVGDFMPLSARAEFLSTLQRLESREEGSPSLMLELPMELADRPGVDVRFQYALSWIADSSQVCLCVQDVTEERQLQKKILQQEKDVLLDSLLGGIAHELNNKALPLLGYSELLSNEATAGADADPAKIIHYTEVIKKSSSEFSAIVHQLLQLVKPGGKPTPVDLCGVLRETASLLAFQIADAKVSIIDRLPAEPVPILADAAQIKQIFVNLLVNAVDAMRTSFQKELVLAIRIEGNQAFVDVTDSGVGIPPEILPRIFDPFFTTKAAETARGLGLSVCRSLARQFGGEISVESAPAKGSCFTARFPLTTRALSSPSGGGNLAPPKIASMPASPAPAAGPAPEGSSPGEPPPAPAPTHAPAAPRIPEVLVVDDEPNVGNLVSEILKRKFKANVRRAMHGEEAVAALTEVPEGFDLIVSDVRMPFRNGIELFRWIAANRPQQTSHFFFMTGHDGTNEMSEEIARSNVPVLRKPFPIDTLVKLAHERMRVAA
ncbi:Signal transduction histidine kinase [Verrucomicrobium sp. GAS474]|uniref:ATP-binding protein n=1 Tax=Verrucomicrobium sp. GAS474 TaxID=1882831 RepID=UPI0008792C2A|nr:ATP-binding protein [Verrucomicrobium sp. GAS474]SDT87952.1 Signal transduction histidine kinase [Verrucomicrobium sp. GAS474]